MFFKNGKRLKAIQKKLLKQKDTIDAYLSELAPSKRNRVEWCTVHNRECKSTGLLMWRKDLDLRYTFLNTRHCNDFYRISLADVRDMIGKTDAELIVDFTKRTGLKHSFGDMCSATDNHVLETRKSARFWELGYIGGEIMILDVTKSPIFAGEEIVGVSAWALNQSSKECEMKSLLELFLKKGQAKRMDKPNGKKIASYIITKKDNPFNGVFPK